jgi:hypothetical protein
MDPRHADYVSYYEARARRYAGDPLYPRSAEAERRLYEAIRGCARLEDFRTVVETQKPELACAVARTLDQAAARAEQFRALAEPVRARGPEEILAAAAGAADVVQLVSLVGEIMTRNSLAITVDEFVDRFGGDFKILEDIEVDTAIVDQVPGEWKPELAEGIADNLDRGRQHYQKHTRPQAQKWAAGWELDHAQVWEERHRRKIPEPDAVVARRIEQHRRYLGMK